MRSAKGLRIGIHPLNEGESDLPRRDDRRTNLVLLPLPHDGAFMELSYGAWQMVELFLASDARVPRESIMPDGPRRLVARELMRVRDAPVVDVINMMRAIGQPELLETTARDERVEITRGTDVQLESVVAPVARPVLAPDQ